MERRREREVAFNSRHDEQRDDTNLNLLANETEEAEEAVEAVEEEVRRAAEAAEREEALSGHLREIARLHGAYQVREAVYETARAVARERC